MAKRKKPIDASEVKMKPNTYSITYSLSDDSVVGFQASDESGNIVCTEQDAKAAEIAEVAAYIEGMEPIWEAELKLPKAREFEARPCSSCQAIRPHGKNYSRVYCTRGNIRYCKCHFCNHTWSQEGK